MAFNLRAILRLEDRFSTPARRIAREAERADRATRHWVDSSGRLRDSMGRFARQADSASHSTSRFRGEIGRGFGGALKGIGSLSLAIGGIATAFAGAVSAKKIFDATVGAAATYEQSSVMISAMFDDKKLSDQYMDMVNNLAIASPILDSQGMFQNSKSFISQTKNLDELQQMWDLAQRMAAIDPIQGVEGSVLALKEFFSGDITSMVERFELSRSTMKDMKNLKLPDQLKELDKYFNKIGMTKKLVEEMGGTTLGIWQQIKEKVAVVLRDMGAPALQVIKKFLDGLNTGISGGKLDGFKQTGAKMLENVATGFVNAATGIGKWIDSIRNNKEFQEKTTLFGQVKWVIEDVYAKFLEWLNNGGRDKITKVVSDLIQILIAGIEASMQAIIPVAKTVGAAIGEGIKDGFSQALKDSWMVQMMNNPVEFAKKKGIQEATKFFWNKTVGTKGQSKASGLSRVPYNGFQATLHKDERVLTPEESKSYNEGKGGNSYAFHVTLNGTGSTEKDADKLFEYFVKKIEFAGGAGA